MYKKYLIGVQDLCMLRKLGKGSFASVYLARLVDTQQTYAVKVLNKHLVSNADLYQQVMMERTAAVMASRYVRIRTIFGSYRFHAVSLEADKPV